MQLSPFQAQSRVCCPARSGSPATTTTCLEILASCAGKISGMCQQDVCCLLLNSLCALSLLCMSLQYMQKPMSLPLPLVSMAPVGAHSALLHIGMPCDLTLLSLQLFQQTICPAISIMQMQELSSSSNMTTAYGACGRVKQGACV